MTVVVGVALALLILRTATSRGGNDPFGPETVTLSADVVGFAVFLAVAIAVARDHRTGAVDLIRTLTPRRPRHLVARAVGSGLLAVIAVGVVIAVGMVVLLVLAPEAIGWSLADVVARTVVATFLLAGCGVGIGAASRSTAGASCAAITVYWLLPVGLMVAGLAGASWSTSISDATLGVLAGEAVRVGAEHWAAVGGIALWTLALGGLGLIRETAGSGYRPRARA